MIYEHCRSALSQKEQPILNTYMCIVNHGFYNYMYKRLRGQSLLVLKVRASKVSSTQISTPKVYKEDVHER